MIWRLFLSFLQIGLFSVGGGYVALPLVQAQAVEQYAWITMSEFTDLVTIAEMTPGPIVINAATFVGMKVAGPAGAVVATLASILPSCFIASLLSYLYYKYKDGRIMQTVLDCLRPAVVALIASAALSILATALFGGRFGWSRVQWPAVGLFAVGFVLLRRRCSPILVLCLCGAAGLILGLCGVAF